MAIKKPWENSGNISFWRWHPESNWGIEVLQTSALPLGYVTKENITKYDKFHNTISKWNLSIKMTPTRFELVLPPWKGDVLTAWPRSQVSYRSYMTSNNHRIIPSSPSRARTYNITVNSRALYHWAIEECSFAGLPSCLQNRILTFTILYLHSIHFWSSPRPISTHQLNTLRYLHTVPINLVLSKGSYLLLGDISSWGGLHA